MPIGRIGIFAIKGGNAHRCRGAQGGVEKLVGVRHAGEAAHGVRESNQGVRLAAAKLGVETKDGANLVGMATDPKGNQLEDIPDALGRVGVGKEQLRALVLVGSVAPQHLREVRRKVALPQRTLQNIRSRLTDGEQIVGHGVPDCL
ncbi:MAG: hypothetical protein AW06_000598 [Candidatus Accumulibacter cognatus]|uniref:Uncharacterized protein n=1 Tax=Candidatus Accumulibacter cognatus TaxID=2954383 RepID=A0A080MKP3_9PROT|nr:MAG: hypothetical protein AW06_000598 [Candidatus Accumulibacter cognatus]